jgi:hypothetical protein
MEKSKKKQKNLIKKFKTKMERQTADGLEGLSVRELKTLLDERRVDYRDCVEKRDLIRRARETVYLPRRTTIASLECIVFDSTSASPAPPEWVVIILHVRGHISSFFIFNIIIDIIVAQGYGANREDLVPLGQAAAQQMTAATTDAASGPRVRFIHPNAPLAMTTEGGACACPHLPRTHACTTTHARTHSAAVAHWSTRAQLRDRAGCGGLLI